MQINAPLPRGIVRFSLGEILERDPRERAPRRHTRGQRRNRDDRFARASEIDRARDRKQIVEQFTSHRNNFELISKRRRVARGRRRVAGGRRRRGRRSARARASAFGARPRRVDFAKLRYQRAERAVWTLSDRRFFPCN